MNETVIRTQGYATTEMAAAKADEAFRQTGRDYFVVIESGRYDFVEEAEIDTYYCGIPEDFIIYHTSEGWY